MPRAVDRLVARIKELSNVKSIDSVATNESDAAVRHFQGTTDAGAAIHVLEADVLKSLDIASVDVLYDKDAFGALEPEDRDAYAAQMSRYARAGSTLLIAGKHRTHNVDAGPPYNLPQSLIEKTWNAVGFDLVAVHDKLFGGEPSEDRPFSEITYILKKNRS